MSSVMKELKSEISRVARREVNKQLEPVKRVNATQRGLIADLRRHLNALQKEVNGLRKVVPETEAVEVPSKVRGTRKAAAGKKDEREGAWFTAKGVRSMRKRLGLTQPELARLAGVSSWTVVNWEGCKGKIAMRRQVTAEKLQVIRSMSKKEAQARLVGGKPAAKAEKQ